MSALYYGRNGEPMTMDEWTSARSGEDWKEFDRLAKAVQS